MISETISKLCSNPELIENYDKAMKSPEMWDCHHRRETIYLKEELKEIDEYFHRPPEELIFVTKSRHKWLHYNVCKGWEKYKEASSTSSKGRKHTELSKQKMSKSKKGIKLRPRSEEHCKKLSEVHKGKHLSDETRQKISEANKGKNLSDDCKKRLAEINNGYLFWNNGIVNVRSRECPGPEWKRGRDDSLSKKRK